MATIIEKINEGMKLAMKAKEQNRLEVLRMMKSKIMLVNARGELADPEVVSILGKYAKSVKEIITVAEQNQKTEAAEQAKTELKIVQEFLPPELSEDQVRQKVQEIVTTLGANSVRDMGKVMKECMTKLQGVDGNIVKKIVGEFLK